MGSKHWNGLDGIRCYNVTVNQVCVYNTVSVVNTEAEFEPFGISDQAVIMILGENHFISIADDGSVRFIKRLDYSPMCFHCFIIGWYWGEFTFKLKCWLKK